MLAILLTAIALLILIKVWFRTISFMEFIAQVAVTLIISGLFWGLSLLDISAYDQEVWNGEITKMEDRKESCPIGWVGSKDSFCTEYTSRTTKIGESCSQNKDGSRVCTDITMTEYNYDYSWERRYFITSNVGKWEIERIDPQGVKYPKAFSETSVGDPASATNYYKNWIQAASDSIYNEAKLIEDRYKEFLPDYPIEIYSYFKLNRVLAIDVPVENQKELNKQLAIALKDLGPKRQMNAIVVIVNADNVGSDYPYALRRHWKGFKKNDAVLVLGVSNGNVVWRDSMSWSKNPTYDIEVRDSIELDKPLNVQAAIDSIHKYGMEFFERRSMKEFEFLKDQIPTPTWFYVVALITQLVSVAGLTFFFHRN